MDTGKNDTVYGVVCRAAFTLVCLVVGVCAAVLSGCDTDPITGETRLMLIDRQSEREMGREYAPEVEKQLGGAIADAALQEYVNSVGRKIGAVSHMPELDYHYTAVNSEKINAVCLPGGYIFITRGLLEKLSSEAQLAGVLAHETVHAALRHSAQAISIQIGMNLLMSAAAREKTPESALMVANLASQLTQLKYSRDHEYQADSAGVDYMVKAGYNPMGMVEVIEVLEKENSIRPIEFFATHPSPEHRKQEVLYKVGYIKFTPDLKVGKEEYKKNVLERLKMIPKKKPKQNNRSNADNSARAAGRQRRPTFRITLGN